MEFFIKDLGDGNLKYAVKNADGRKPLSVANALLCVEIDYLCDAFGIDKQKAMATVFRGMAEQLMELGMPTTSLHMLIELTEEAAHNSKDGE